MMKLTLEEAEAYKEALKRKVRRTEEFIVETNNFYKTTEEHQRKKYNPEAEDEVVIVPKHDKMICSPMEVTAYLEDLLLETEKLLKEMEKAKKEVSLKFENPFFLEKEVIYERISGALKKLADFKESETENFAVPTIKVPDFLKKSSNNSIPRPPVPGTVPPPPSFMPKKNGKKMEKDYKLNAAGEQVTYYYAVEKTVEADFDKEAVKEMLEKHKKEMDELRNLKKQMYQQTEISYKPKYRLNSTIEEDLKFYLAMS